MKIGICLPIWQLEMKDAEMLTEKADELGLDGVFIPEHVIATPDVLHYGPNWPDPFAALAYFAGRTSRVQLGTSVVVLPNRGNPLAQAKAGATVDQVSGGRFIFGVGIGWADAEFKLLRIPFEERAKITDEYIRIIKAAWTSEEPSFEGEYYSFSGAVFKPQPVQKPHPPIWVAAKPLAITRTSIRRTVALGDAWHPVFLSREDLEKGATMLREAAAKAGRRDGPQFAPRNLLNLTDETKGDGRAVFEGSPDEVAADVRWAEAIGVDYLVLDTFSRPDPPSMARMLEQFAKEVQPAVA